MASLPLTAAPAAAATDRAWVEIHPCLLPRGQVKEEHATTLVGAAANDELRKQAAKSSAANSPTRSRFAS